MLHGPGDAMPIIETKTGCETEQFFVIAHSPTVVNWLAGLVRKTQNTAQICNTSTINDEMISIFSVLNVSRNVQIALILSSGFAFRIWIRQFIQNNRNPCQLMDLECVRWQ
jgi:hypothetical protein